MKVIGAFIALIVCAYFPISAHCFEYEAKIVDDESYYINNEEFEPDCSIYCTIPEPNYQATSFLMENKENTYFPKNSDDRDLKTAWIEGSDDYGIGEKLKISFDLSSVPKERYGINEIYILNGYRKSPYLWSTNSRVKSFRFFIDNNEAGTINLIDTIKLQSIQLPMYMLKPKSLNCFEFEILSVYEGSEFKDTAITELYFSGVGSH